jgi:hypothetical protein
MLIEKDYCDWRTVKDLESLGMNVYTKVKGIDVLKSVLLYEAQKWLREEKGIHIAPRIYLYHDINLDEQTSWECTIYVEWSAIYTIGKSLTYEDALLLGIKEAVKILKEKDGIS